MSDNDTLAPAAGGGRHTRAPRHHAPVQPPHDSAANLDGGDTDRCGHCGALAATQSLHLCTGCRQRKYCNQACQLAAWRAGHKRECKLLKADAETKPNSNASDSAAAKTQVTNSDHPDRKNIKNHTPDKSYAEPSNGWIKSRG